jgi:hypothetical protein
MKRIMIFISCVALLATGCISKRAMTDRMSTGLVGKRFDEFVVKYGAPYRNFPLSDGRVSYTWSNIETVRSPIIVSPLGAGAFAAGGPITNCCEVQLIVDGDGRITNVSVLRDSKPRSLCLHIFGSDM